MTTTQAASAAAGAHLARSGQVARITISNPTRRNAISPAVLGEIRGHLRELGEDGTTRVVVLTSEDSSPFSSGFDLTSLLGADGANSRPAIEAAGAVGEREIADTVAAITTSPLPVLAAIRGYCIGAALQLVLACDYRVADEDAFVQLPVLRVGFPYAERGLRHLVRELSATTVRGLLWGGARISAHRAMAVGIVHELAPADEVDEVCDRVASGIADCAPDVVAELKARLARAGQADASTVGPAGD